MNSTSDDIERGAGRRLPGGVAAVLFGAAGGLVALVLGLLTFGVQATAAPRHLPLAVGVSDAAAAPALAPVVGRVSGEGGDAVAWRTVGSRAEAERLLDAKEVYGALLFDRGPAGVAATVLLSGAVNPSATQVALPVLEQVAAGVTSALRAPTAPGPAAAPPEPVVRVVTIHPASAAGRTLPLAASALLWLGTLVASALAVVAGPRLRGRPPGSVGRLAVAATAALLSTAAVLGLARLWDAGIPLTWEAAGFLALVGIAFALVQSAVLRVLDVRGLALLVPLYLTAPATAGLVPELLDPVYRWALWSWTPFRFAAEGLRSGLFLGWGAADVTTALWVFVPVALAGLVLTIAPRPRRQAPLRRAPSPG
jgi:hypothetical protein